MERTERLRREQLLRNQKEESSKDDQWLKQSERHSTYSVSAQVAAQLVEKAIQDKQSGLRVKVSFCLHPQCDQLIVVVTATIYI